MGENVIRSRAQSGDRVRCPDRAAPVLLRSRFPHHRQAPPQQPTAV